MTVKTRETLMQRAMTGKPIMGQELRDLIDTMFWLKASPEQRIAQVVQQVAGRSTPQETAAFPDVPGTGFIKIGADRKWFTDPTVYLTQPQGDSFYFRNSLFPMDPSLYLAGDRTFKNFTDSARAAFTGGDGIDIVSGDIAVDNTVSRVGHIHDDRYYTETETDALIETRVPKHRFPINDDGTYNVVPSYSNTTRQITLTPTDASFDVWINGTKHTFTGAQTLPQHPATSGVYFYFLDENGVFQVATTPFELLKVAPVAIVIWNATKGEGRWIHEFHTTRMSARTHELLHEKGSVIPKNSFAISGFTKNTDTPAAVSFGVAGGLLRDEDIKHQIPALADGGPYEIWYRTGASGDWTWDSVSTLPYKYGATYFTVNQIVTGAWAQVEINAGGVDTYGNLFVVVTPNNGGVPIICVQGQNTYTDPLLARAESWDAMDRGSFPFPEYFALYRVTYKASVAYSGVTGRVRIEDITRVTQGTESGVSGATVHNSLSGRDAIDAHPALSITDIYNLANGAMLKKISTGIVAATAADLPAHASRHHSGGADPLAGQSIAGLLTSSSPTFANLNLLTASAGTLTDLSFRSATNLRRFVIRWDNPNDYLQLFTNNDDGSSRIARMLIPRSSSLPIRMYSGVTITGTTTLDTSLSGMLKATAGVVSVAGAADVPAHATRHHWDGTDPITGQLLAGLLPNDVPVFSGLRSGSVTGYFPIRGNTGVEIARFNSSGFISYGDITLSGDLSIANLSGILYAANGRVRVAIGSDLPAHTHYTTDVSEGTNLWFTYQRARDAISGSHPMSVVNGVVLHADTDGYRHVPANGNTNSGKFLVSGGAAGSYTWETISAGSLPVHAFRHHYNGSDPLAGQSIAGLLVSSSPEFAGLKLGSLTGMLKAAAGVISVAGASDLPAHASRHHSGGADPLAGQSIAGLLTTDSPEFNRLTLGSELRLKYVGTQEWGMVAGNSGFELSSRNANWSAIDWPVTIGHAAGGVIRLGGTTSRPVNLTYSLQLGGVDTITSTRAGRFTGMRLTNLTSGQIPVCSDANGEITASGQTDDGTYFTSDRTLRLWNTMARSGGVWTDLQWTPDAQERISMVSSNGSGVGAYHTFVVVPADSEATGRELGYYSWGQKLSGKSGSYPGLKASLGVTTKGAGGSTGGFGSQFHFDYRPDNGSILSTALRIGAFGGSTADAVEAAILLRANAGLRVTALTAELVKSNSTGVLSNATANTDYLPVNNPVSTGTFKANVTQHTARTYVGGARTIDPGLTPKFQRQTGAGTITLPTAIASYEGLEYKITFHGRFNVTFDTPSGEIYTLAAGASYWYNVASTTVSAGDASGENCACDVWCDGSNWYIRW